MLQWYYNQDCLILAMQLSFDYMFQQKYVGKVNVPDLLTLNAILSQSQDNDKRRITNEITVYHIYSNLVRTSK